MKGSMIGAGEEPSDVNVRKTRGAGRSSEVKFSDCLRRRIQRQTQTATFPLDQNWSISQDGIRRDEEGED